MKVKTSITLSPETLRAVDRLAGKRHSRSTIIEHAVREYVARRERRQRDARDLEILDAAADELDREMSDVLAYQDDLEAR
jgi:predicted transcriptional regulator